MAVYDYSFARPDPALLGEGVMRYLAAVNTQTRGKVLTPAELDTLHQAMKPVGLVYEAGADPSTWDGAEALRQAAALGFPHDRPIYFAADRYIGAGEWDDVAQLLDNTVVPVERRGLYAGAPLVQVMLDEGHIRWGWIAGALSWSMSPPYSTDRATALAPGAHLLQLVGSDVPGTDANTALKPDWGGWHPDIPHAPTQGDDMDLTAQNLQDISNAVVGELNRTGARQGTTTLGGTLVATDENVSQILALVRVIAAQPGHLSALTDADFAKIAKVVNDEDARRKSNG